MRNLNLEAAIWNLFTSIEFFEAAARDCEDTMSWFGTLAISRKTANFGRNNQIYDKLKQRACDLRRGAELAKLGDYTFIWDISDSIRGDARGMMDQPLHSWMNETEFREFEALRVKRLLSYASKITHALHNGIVGAEYFLHPSPDYPERIDDDDGYPGDDIVRWYHDHIRRLKAPLDFMILDPLTEYVVDKSTACQTGDEVPWTGVWYPATGLERHSLSFAIKGMRMQPTFRVIKTVEELKSESEGAIVTRPKTLALATVWHPVVPSGHIPNIDIKEALKAKSA